MPEKNKTLEKEIKARIKELNKQTGANLSFTKLYEDIVSAQLPYKEQGDRDQEMIVIYTEGVSQLSDKMLTRHSAIVSNPILRARYKDDPATKYTITMADAQMKELIEKMIRYIDPDKEKGFFLSEEQLNAIRNFEYGSLKCRTLYEEWPKCIKGWDHECFYKDIETIDNTFNTVELSNDKYKFDKRRGNEKDVKVAELYYKSKIIKDEVDSYGFFMRLIYRIFNSKLMNAYDAFVQKAKETLDRIGFNEETHGAEAIRMLYGKTMPPHENDIKFVESMRNQRSLDNEKKVHDIQAKLIEDAKADIEREYAKYNEKNGTNLTYQSEDESKTDKNNSKTVENVEKDNSVPKKDTVIESKTNKNIVKENPAPEKSAVADKKEIPVKKEDKKPPRENIPKPQEDVKKEDPNRNRIDVLDDENALLPFGEAPEIKVEAPPKRGPIKKFFGWK